VPPCWACFKISTLQTRAVELFFMLASVWAKTRCNRIKRPSTDVFGRMYQQTSVSRAKREITKYKKALGDRVGVAELMVFYCERAAGFCQEVDHRDTAYFDARARMFGQALKATAGLTGLTGNIQNGFLARLDHVRSIGRRFGSGVGEHMDILFAEYASSFHARSASWKER